MAKFWRILEKTWLAVIAAFAAALVWLISTYFIDDLKKQMDDQLQGINNYQYFQNEEMSLEANVNVLENGCIVDTSVDRLKKLCVAYGNQAGCLFAFFQQGQANRGAYSNDSGRKLNLEYDSANVRRINNRRLDSLKSEVKKLDKDMLDNTVAFARVGNIRFNIWRVKRESWEWWRNALFMLAGIVGASNAVILALREDKKEQDKIEEERIEAAQSAGQRKSKKP